MRMAKIQALNFFLAQKKGTSGTTEPRKKTNFNEDKAQKKLKKIKRCPQEH